MKLKLILKLVESQIDGVWKGGKWIDDTSTIQPDIKGNMTKRNFGTIEVHIQMLDTSTDKKSIMKQKIKLNRGSSPAEAANNLFTSLKDDAKKFKSVRKPQKIIKVIEV